jgi:endoglucanase
MQTFDFLKSITTVPGTSGNETAVAAALRDAFAPYCDEAYADAMGSAVAIQRGTGKGPKIMIVAHLDEVSLMSMEVCDDGAIRFMSIGVASQIMPAQEVYVLTCEGPKFGVIGAKPPHLLSAEDKKKPYKTDELYVDIGMAADEVKRLVPAGTPIQLIGATTMLKNNRAASKTMDDRACVAIMLRCAQEMKRRAHDADIYYVATASEETNCLGAITSAYAIDPDMAFVLDVTHGSMEGCAPGDTCPIGCTPFAVGPNLHEKLTAFIRERAERLRMETYTEVCPGNTYTDAWWIQVSREGVPCALVSLPLKYMHTSVELCDLGVIEAQAHLLAETISDMNAGWEETLCY